MAIEEEADAWCLPAAIASAMKNIRPPIDLAWWRGWRELQNSQPRAVDVRTEIDLILAFSSLVNHGKAEAASPSGDGLPPDGGSIGCVGASAVAGIGAADSWIEFQSESAALTAICSTCSFRSNEHDLDMFCDERR